MFNLTKTTDSSTNYIAAIDLGSNSFHMIIGRWEDDQLVVVDKLREPVRLGWGLMSDGSLSQEARDRAMTCLEKFGERLRGYPSRSVRIVGTKTLRSINDASQFLHDAQACLGHPVEIISGDEEARLIYLGVAHCIAPKDGNRLVMDIGGGSTEVIVGQGMQPLVKESLNMGCVAITKRYLTDKKITASIIEKAYIACLQELEPVAQDFINKGWNEVLGASGTIKAVAKVCIANGWSEGEIRAEYLDKILSLYEKFERIDLKIQGLSDDRMPVFLGGVIVLKALFNALQFAEITAADWALREGLLFDLKGRLDNVDIRQGSVDALASRFHVNMEKARAVEATALELLEQVEDVWDINISEAGKLLGWAARLYSIGLDISHNDYHKHSAYIVQYVNLAGFSRVEQAEIASLVLAHRKRFPTKNFPMQDQRLIYLAILLRLAVIFHRGKPHKDFPSIHAKATLGSITLKMPSAWLEQHPLTQADVETEARYLEDLNFLLEIH